MAEESEKKGTIVFREVRLSVGFMGAQNILDLIVYRLEKVGAITPEQQKLACSILDTFLELENHLVRSGRYAVYGALRVAEVREEERKEFW